MERAENYLNLSRDTDPTMQNSGPPGLYPIRRRKKPGKHAGCRFFNNLRDDATEEWDIPTAEFDMITKKGGIFTHCGRGHMNGE